MTFKVHQKTKALIFDLYGKLSDSLPVQLATWNKSGGINGFIFDPYILFGMTGRSTIEFAVQTVE